MSEPETRWLHVRHDTRYTHGTGAAVELAHHMAYLRPRETPLQHIHGWTLDVQPEPDGDVGLVHQSQDPWGNWRAYFSHSRVHDDLLVSSDFLAELTAAEPLDPLDSPPWEQVATQLRYRARAAYVEAVEFALGSPYAPRDAALARFAAPDFPPGRPLLDGAVALMSRVYRSFEYKPLSTSVATRALDALAKRQGVCQDFAHVMIGALRSLGLAARYVSGYLLTHPPAGQPRLIGADASHAWVSVWCPRQGWIALDPTNDVPAALDHVTLAWGRDYADVAPLRGVIRGGGRAVPQVAVTVEPWVWPLVELAPGPAPKPTPVSPKEAPVERPDPP
ncbi:MAG: transglutaminase domain-containing protein [Leptothrix sp. (in: b-proteobacteria)]